MRNRLVFMLLSMFLVGGVSAVEFAYDGFENSWSGGEGWNGAWYHGGGGNSAVVSVETPYAGSSHLRLSAANGYVDRSFVLSNTSGAKLSFYAKVNSFEGNDFATFLASSDGVNWVEIKRFGIVDSDNTYKYYEFDLSQYAPSSNFYIAIDAQMNAQNDLIYFDEVNVFNEEVVEPPIYDIKRWHIQFNPTPINPDYEVEYWNLDLFDVSAEEMQALKNKGVFVMCYFSGGSWEDWREDAGQFPPEVLGNGLDGWPGERWLDVRSQIVRDLMKVRIDLGIQKGCDGFDPDNMDGYQNNNGLGLVAQDNIDYYNYLADYIHSNGKKVGLKNALSILPFVVENIDWEINEQCFFYSECNLLDPVVAAGKPVFQIEYGGLERARQVCPQANAIGFSTLIKTQQLDDYEINCEEFGLSKDLITYDGFENSWSGGMGWNRNWEVSGDAAIVSNAGPFDGSRHLRLRSTGEVQRSFVLNSGKIGFFAKAKSLEGSDIVNFKISSDGVNWENLRSFTTEDSDNTYRYYQFELSEFANGQNLWISFEGEMSGTGDYFYIDEVLIM